jgi:hypothetical protein
MATHMAVKPESGESTPRRTTSTIGWLTRGLRAASATLDAP